MPRPAGVRHGDPAQCPPVGGAESRASGIDLRPWLSGKPGLYGAGARAHRPPAAAEGGSMSEEQETSAGKAPPRRKLGRGLGALMGDTRREEVLVHRDGAPGESPGAGDRARLADMPREGLAHIPIAAISPLPGQPRQYF